MTMDHLGMSKCPVDLFWAVTPGFSFKLLLHKPQSELRNHLGQEIFIYFYKVFLFYSLFIGVM